MSKFQVLLLLCLKLFLVSSRQRKLLDGVWKIDGVYRGINGVVPGGIYTDLVKNGLIGDIFAENNDVKTRWISTTSWNYYRDFEVTKTFLDHKNINLVFDGVDTFSSVYINDKLVGSTENMFVRYQFDVKPNLNIGVNRISVNFTSPVSKAKKIADEQSKNYTVVPVCVPYEYNGECHVNHIRKMQASFAWDWGPAFPSMGIWKRVYLESYNHTNIRDVTIKYVEDVDFWKFTVITYFTRNVDGDLKGKLLIKLVTDLETVSLVYDVNILLGENDEFVDKREFKLKKGLFSLWWPNGYGKQTLYKMEISFSSLDYSETSMKTIRFGMRTIELIQTKLDVGADFYFKVNGIPIFAKGTNIIPSHILPELGQNVTRIRYLLQSCKDVHMNMIRVWGGGVYESDEFYEIADEMGLMIWQDFMFACSMYPTSPKFLKSVMVEVEQQVRRLQHHACIAIWAGNNENEAALVQNWYGTKTNFSLFEMDYVKLYVHTVKKVALQNDDSRPFLVSSPTNGKKSEASGHVDNDPQSVFYGDVHYYNYFMDSWNSNIYPITRFASEYGYQSLPSVKTILRATSELSNLNFNSEFMQHRQHHMGGYEEILDLIEARLKLPSNNSTNFDTAYIFYSQIIQAMAIKIETEFYRQWHGRINKVGKGNTMGALYWQLNDVWVAPTWSGIDFYGNWKMLHYYAKNFFAPVIVTAHFLPSRDIDVFVVSDSLKPIFNATLCVYSYNWTNFTPKIITKKTVNIKTGSNKVYTFWTRAKYNKNFFYFTLRKGDEQLSPDNFLFADPIKNSNIQNAAVKLLSVDEVNCREFLITISANTIAAFVWLESDVPGRFSENGFVQVTPLKKVRFYADECGTAEEIKKYLHITHLRDKNNL